MSPTPAGWWTSGTCSTSLEAASADMGLLCWDGGPRRPAAGDTTTVDPELLSHTVRSAVFTRSLRAVNNSQHISGLTTSKSDRRPIYVFGSGGANSARSLVRRPIATSPSTVFVAAATPSITGTPTASV